MTTDPIALLMDEHRLFERIFDALDAWADHVETTHDPSDLELFVTVLAELVDNHHHGKEEDILFAAMIDRGFPSDGGPLAVMLHEHDLGRSHVRALRALATVPRAAPAQLVTHARAFTQLMRPHILKEDHVLYPMARRVLGPDLWHVGERCARYESAAHVAARVAELTATAALLIDRYPAAQRAVG